MTDSFFLSFRLASGEREICLFEEISPRLVSDEIEMTALKWLSVIPMRSEESYKMNWTVKIKNTYSKKGGRNEGFRIG